MIGAEICAGYSARRHAGTRPLDRADSTRDNVMLEDVDLFAGFFVACEREDGLPQLRIWRFLDDGPEASLTSEIAFPSPRTCPSSINRIFETTTFRYAYQSLVTPVRSTNTTRKRRIHASQTGRNPGGFDRTLYAASVFMLRARWSQVPVSLVYRKDKREESGNPVYVYGYGLTDILYRLALVEIG